MENAKKAFDDTIKKGKDAYKENVDRIKKYWNDQWDKAKKELDKFLDDNFIDDESSKETCPEDGGKK